MSERNRTDHQQPKIERLPPGTRPCCRCKMRDPASDTPACTGRRPHPRRTTCAAPTLPPSRGTLTKKSGKVFRVGIFLGFVWLTTRTPHGGYVRGARRNRIDRHGGEIERLAPTLRSHPGRPPAGGAWIVSSGIAGADDDRRGAGQTPGLHEATVGVTPVSCNGVTPFYEQVR